VLLPEDPDASARGIRARLRDLSGANVGVVVTDTSGRAWREGQTDIAIGAAGIVPLLAYAGRTDGHGNALAVTAPAVADQVAGAAELVQTKLGGRPFAVVRGLEHLVLAPDDDGPGARSLVRAPDADLFGYGAREAVVRAVSGDPAEQPPFGAPAPATELAAVLLDVLGIVTEPDGDGLVVDPAAPRDVRLGVLAFAHGWQVASGDTGECRIRPVTP
jgi:coenzyme F420-0:L-glutamate ligase/coenzyme F420-1:gamma-L-glutamate ligase